MTGFNHKMGQMPKETEINSTTIYSRGFHQTSFKFGINSEWGWQNGRHDRSIC
jgi:hypothetical protein